MNIHELLTITQVNSISTISVRTSPSCQQLLNFHLNIWQSKTGFLLSLLLQDGIQVYCWVELQCLKLGNLFCFHKITSICFIGKKNKQINYNNKNSTQKKSTKRNSQKDKSPPPLAEVINLIMDCIYLPFKIFEHFSAILFSFFSSFNFLIFPSILWARSRSGIYVRPKEQAETPTVLEQRFGREVEAWKGLGLHSASLASLWRGWWRSYKS